MYDAFLLLALRVCVQSVDPDYDGDIIRVPGSFGYFITRLADEYTKSLQKINPHTSDYIRYTTRYSLIELVEHLNQDWLAVRAVEYTITGGSFDPLFRGYSRLKDEAVLLRLCKSVKSYYERVRTALNRLDRKAIPPLLVY